MSFDIHRVERSHFGWKQCTTKEILQISFQRCNKPWPENISYHVIFTICWRIPLNTIILCLYLCVYFCKLNSVLLLRLFHCRMKDTLLMLALSLSLSHFSITLFQKKNEKDEKTQWACFSVVWSGGLIGISSYNCDGWSEKRISKLLNSYFIVSWTWLKSFS